MTSCRRLSDIASITQGSWNTKVITMAVEIELFTKVSSRCNTPEKVSEECGLDLRIVQMLINALAGLRLLVKKNGVYVNSEAAERYLVKGKDCYVGDFVTLLGEEYYDVWRGFSNVIATGKPVRDDRRVRLSDPRYGEKYIKAMHEISMTHATSVAKRFDFKGMKSLLEVGGGHGTYSVLIAKENPGIKATVFESPFACVFVKEHASASGARGVSAQEGDFVLGNLPKGHDVVMLTHVLGGLPPEKCEAVLGKAYDALPKGGAVMVNEFKLESNLSRPSFSSMFSLNAFMLSNGGALYPYEQISEWLGNVGFTGVKVFNSDCEFIITLTATKG